MVYLYKMVKSITIPSGSTVLCINTSSSGQEKARAPRATKFPFALGRVRKIK